MNANKLKDLIRKLVGRQLVEEGWDYSRGYLATVVSSAGAGPSITVDVMTSHPALPPTGLTGLPVRLGLPGITVDSIEPGTEVLVRFEELDPTRPYVAEFLPSEALAITYQVGDPTLGSAVLQVNNGSDSLALTSKAEDLLTSILDWLQTHTHGTGVGPSSPPVEAPDLATMTVDIGSTRILTDE